MVDVWCLTCSKKYGVNPSHVYMQIGVLSENFTVIFRVIYINEKNTRDITTVNGKHSVCQKWKEQQFCADETQGQANARTENRK